MRCLKVNVPSAAFKLACAGVVAIVSILAIHELHFPLMVSLRPGIAAYNAVQNTNRQMTTAMKPRQEWWRESYRNRRYARHLSQQELDRRIRDIVLNLLRLTKEAKIGLPKVSQDSAIWMEKWTHVLEEMRLRYGPYPNGFTRNIFHSEPFPDFVSALAQKAASRLDIEKLSRGDVLLKFGKRAFMERLYTSGHLRIQPASFYSTVDNNGAIRDDELKIPFSLVLSRDDIARLVINPEDVPSDAPDQRIDVTFGADYDYWLFCVTQAVEPRLFVDFAADACVVIRQRPAFTERLQREVQKRLPDARFLQGEAVYVDPLLPKSANVFVPFCKHFGYSYQDEYRFCWLPSSPTRRLTHFDIELGSLKDIAELIVCE